jgi:DeoR family transcriptional regulator, aga operon transcriptional repressor
MSDIGGWSGHHSGMAPLDPARQTSTRRTERLTAILDTLAATGAVSVANLSGALSVSEATLRRDLALLEQQLLIKRTHGGARSQDYAYELPVRYRDSQNRHAKRRIAAACAAAIARKPQAVALGGGTTTSEVARHLADRAELTIITNAINIAMELAMRPRLRVIVTGGVLRSESYELVGAWTERFLESLNIAVTVMGVDGISAEGGLTTHDAVEARTDQRMIERAQRVIVVADKSKLGLVTMAKLAEVSDVDLLITEAEAPPEQIRALRAAGLEVQLA